MTMPGMVVPGMAGNLLFASIKESRFLNLPQQDCGDLKMETA
jgi:hypothetical protein